MKPLTKRNYETHPITREELVCDVMRSVDALTRAKKALDKFDKEKSKTSHR